MKTHFKKHARPAFTLLELMVAVAITVIIVTVLVGITGTATDVWTRSRSDVRAARQAKAFLDTMAKDFESMVSRRGNDFEWLVATEDDGANLPAVSESGGSPTVASLTFFTSATDRYFGMIGDDQVDQGGDVSCVSYRMRYDDPVGDGSGRDVETFILYRRLVNPDEAFENLLGNSDLESAFSTYEGSVTESDNFICENVCQFTVTFLLEVTTEEGGTKTTRIERVSVGSGAADALRVRGTGIVASGSDVTEDELKSARLTGVELSISVISDAGLVRMSAKDDGLSEEDYARQVRHFSRQVIVPSM